MLFCAGRVINVVPKTKEVQDMKINYTQHKRKDLAKAVGEFTGVAAKYMGPPSFAYQIDYFTIDREGFLIFDDMADSEEIEALLEFLAEKGFVAEPPEGAEEEEETETAENAVTIPKDKVNVPNLQALLKAKGNLIQKALGTHTVEISETENGVVFPWFDEEVPETYIRFISAICKMSTEQKRINAKAKDVENERYAFRCFLLRLGFIGNEYKADRKLLLQKLEGNCAFKRER